jgi:hypothetical protein
MAAVRVSIKWFGTRKTLTPEQKSQAADTFGAEGNFLSAGKKLIDMAHPAFRAVTAVRHKIVSLWRAVSLPYQSRSDPSPPRSSPRTLPVTLVPHSLIPWIGRTLTRFTSFQIYER